MTVREYVESLPSAVSTVLLDLLAASGSSTFDKKKGAALYPEVCHIFFAIPRVRVRRLLFRLGRRTRRTGRSR